MSATSRQCRNQCNAGDKADFRDPHALQRRIQGLGSGGGELPHRQDHHRLERGGRVSG